MTEPGEGDKGKFKINFSPDRLRKFLHSESKSDAELYAEVSRHSRDYQDALGLSEEDIELIEKRQGRLGMYPSGEAYFEGAILRAEVGEKTFAVFAKHTACHDYGEEAGWRDLLMAVSSTPSLNKSAGYGTMFITAVPNEWHERIIEAIKQSASSDDLSGELFGFVKK